MGAPVAAPISTAKQGASGLGLEAQTDAVTHFVAGRGGEIVASFTETESGKKASNRPELIAALALCRKRRATLVIAKLDRLARNVHFISGLMETGVIQNPSILAYLNRLSDLLWLYGRLIEARRGVDSSLRTADKAGPRWSRAW